MLDPLLQALGTPAGVLVTLDFETYWDKFYSLRKLTTEAYVRDPRFEVIGVGVKVGDRKTVWLEEWQFRSWARRVDWSRVAVCAHHAQFDAFILSHHYGIRPGFLICTMSMGRALRGAGSLNALSELFAVGKKGDEVRKTGGKRRGNFTRAEWLAFGDYCINDVDLTDALLWRMLPEFPALELWVVDQTVRMFTEPVFEADRAVLDKALTEERRRKAETLDKVRRLLKLATLEDARSALASAPQFAEILRKLGVNPPMKPGAKGLIPATAKSDPGMQGLLESVNPDVRQVAEARLEITSRIVETRTERLIQITERGPVPFYLKYCGAHTHRWSGGDKMNPQNFNRGTDEKPGALRGAILAPEGHALVVADSSQIEARVVAWVAGQTELLDTFRRNDAKTRVYKEAFAKEVAALGHKPTKEEARAIDQALAARCIVEGDFYSDEGSRLFRKPISKKETPKERQISKALLLGLGFGMGWAKCAQELLKGMLGTDPVQFTMDDARRYGVNVWAFEEHEYDQAGRTCGDVVNDLITRYGVRLSYADLLVHCAVTDYFVRLYRATNPKIAGTWKAMGQVIEVMARPGPAGVVRMRLGCLSVIREGIIKPNGLVLRYPGLRKAGREWIYVGGDSGREVKRIYGGLLTENVVQSIARDVLAEQAMWIRADGEKLGTTTHDEVVAVTPKPRAERCLSRMITRMRTPPAWCLPLPLNAEGGFARNYGSAK